MMFKFLKEWTVKFNSFMWNPLQGIEVVNRSSISIVFEPIKIRNDNPVCAVVLPQIIDSRLSFSIEHLTLKVGKIYRLDIEKMQWINN